MSHHSQNRWRSGFTLLELSISMAIIGLIIGGVLAGRDLMRDAALRSIVTDANKYRSAIKEFHDQYRYFPGDMPNATKYWGAADTAANGCTNQTADTLTTPGTCDGNGDSIVTFINGPGGTSSEYFQFWKQLSLAGLVAGQYSGLSGPAAGGREALFGTNSPSSKFPGAGWNGAYRCNTAACGPTSNRFVRDYRNWLLLGKKQPLLGGVGFFADAPFLTTLETYTIDQKLDDGLPGAGNVNSALDNPIGTCTTAASNTDYTAKYKLADTSPALCSLVFQY